MESLLQDLRYAGRSFRKAPGFTFVAVLTLGLGIGANTAIFSVLNAVLFRPLPTEGLDRLVVLRTDLPDLNLLDTPLAPPEVVDIAALDDVFEAVTGYSAGDRTLAGHGDPARIATATTLGDFSGVFTVRPFLGTLYGLEQSLEGPHHVAVVSHGLWRQLSGGDADFLGSTIELNGVAHEVIGVMPPEFNYPRGVRVWVPFAYTEQWQQNRGSLFMNTVGRTRPDVTEAQLAARLDAEAARWHEEFFAGSQFGKVLHTTGFVEHLAGPLRLILMVLMGAVIFVLLIAAANVGSLQLVRATGRAKEMAVRRALGAGRRRLLRQVLLEGSLLAVAGALVGLLIGALTIRGFVRWQPAQQMHLTDTPLDGTVLVFTAAIAVFTAIVFGSLPALRGARVEPHEVLRDTVRGASAGVGRQRMLQASVATQIALAVLLLLGSGLMIRTLSQLFAVNPGFDPEQVTTAHVAIPAAVYDSPARRLAFFEQLLERVQAAPGVENASLVVGLPFTDYIDSSPFDIPARPYQPGEPERHHEARIISGDFFRTMRIPLLRGRSFDGTEHSESPGVVVIDETFAEQFFPGEDPVGQEIRGYTGQVNTIIGVAARVDQRELADAPKASAYYSHRQLPWVGSYGVAVHSAQDPGAITAMLRSILGELDPAVPVSDVQTMHGRIEQSLGPRRLAMLALGVFAALSLLLATVGVYGVMKYTTAERTREIGIRMALGAASRNVVGMVLRQAALIVALGLAVGIAVALLATRALSAMLYGVSPTDPVTFAIAVLLLAVVALLSSYLPARRAARTDPMIALRSE